MKQLGLADEGLMLRSKKTRRELFLTEMDSVVPWSRLVALIEPHYPKAGRGRPPMPLESMLRIHFMQHWFDYSDPGMEEALYDIPLLRRFAQLNGGTDALPDETTILKFRRLLERHGLASQMLAEINQLLGEQGLLLKRGTAVDATLIAAAPSTKNKARKRDPEMSSTKKNKDWHFGMKAHIGVDAESGIVHTVVGTAAKVGDAKVVDQLLHGEENYVLGDKAYASNERSISGSDPEKGPKWCMPYKRPPGGELTEWQQSVNRRLSSFRAIVEHPFRIVKRQFKFNKVRYRGLAKNTAALTTKFALANLFQVRRQLLAT